ncbi:hypothetical protein L6R49_27995 [Myxococcota bacterium]|nr:hypothetical protein [Myxococcota bacterium]
MPRVAVTRVELSCALGEDLQAVLAALGAGQRGLSPLQHAAHPDAVGGVVPGPDLKPWLLRRKDVKLLSRAAILALPVCGRALKGHAVPKDQLGLFFGVRREPPDVEEGHETMEASARDGAVDLQQLSTAGKDVYPPLLPLRTLPNLVLAHVAINLGIMGPSDTFAGGPVAGLMGLREAAWAVVEGRCPAALVCAADSAVDATSLRDLRRVGVEGAPGEAAVALVLEPVGAPNTLFELEIGAAGSGDDSVTPLAHHAALGVCGVADGLLALLLAPPGPLRVADGTGAWVVVSRAPWPGRDRMPAAAEDDAP